jgi:hypothetical protein
MKHRIIITLAVLAIFVVWTHIASGQPFEPPNGGGSGGGGPVGAPIDGGLSALIAAGAVLIGRKFYKDRKNR